MFTLILARVDIGQVIGILFLVISILSWFVNVIQGNSPDGNPRQPKPKPKPQSSQSEIQALLQELSVKQQPRPQASESRPPKPPAERPRPKSPPQRQKPSAQPTAAPARQAQRVAEMTLPTANLGAGVRTHQLGNRVEVAINPQVNVAVKEQANRIEFASVPERTVHPLVKVLRESGGVRQALILNEILQRPKTLRR